MARQKILLGSVLTALTTLSLNANAALPGFYLGGQAGWADTHYSASDVNGITSASIDNTNAAGRLFGGYQFNPNWAVEFGYTQFSNTDFTNIQPGGGSGHISQRAVDMLGKGILPFDNGLAISGNLGMAYISNDTSGVLTGSNNKVNPAFGASASYDVTPNVPVSISWNHIQKWGGNIPSTDLISLGLAYNFG